MEESQSTISIIQQQGILPLYFHHDAGVSLQVMRTLYEAGIRVIEYTNRGNEAQGNFKDLIKERNKSMQDLQIGVGTVLNRKQAKAFLKMGADFLVSPAVFPAVAEAANKYDKLWMPGCFTPTEIAMAAGYGTEMVKLFPGKLLGPSFMSMIKDIFTDMVFMPTGGMDLKKDELEAWFHAGVAAVGIGGKLIPQEEMDKGEFMAIGSRANEALRLVREIRNTYS